MNSTVERWKSRYFSVMKYFGFIILTRSVCTTEVAESTINRDPFIAIFHELLHTIVLAKVYSFYIKGIIQFVKSDKDDRICSFMFFRNIFSQSFYFCMHKNVALHFKKGEHVLYIGILKINGSETFFIFLLLHIGWFLSPTNAFCQFCWRCWESMQKMPLNTRTADSRNCY